MAATCLRCSRNFRPEHPSALPAHEPACREAVEEARCPLVDEAGGLLDRGPTRPERAVHGQPGSRHVQGLGEAVLITADVGEVWEQDLEALQRLLGDGLSLRLAVGLGKVFPAGPDEEPHLPHDLGLVIEIPVLGLHPWPPFVSEHVLPGRAHRQPVGMGSAGVASFSASTIGSPMPTAASGRVAAGLRQATMRLSARNDTSS